MNKTAICIEILQILNSRDIIDTKELASLIETNPRNISEYIKELQIAGYDIGSRKGVGGGYFLRKKELFPSLKLSNEEKVAFEEASKYVLNRKDFLNKRDYSFALSKIMSSVNNQVLVEPLSIYDKFPLAMPNDELSLRYNLINEGIIYKKKLKILYLGGSGYKKEHILHPYKAFIYNNSWFLLAWNESINDLGYFKINRMESVKVTGEDFTVLKSFNLSDYLDSFGMKQYGEYYHIRLEFHGVNTAVSERIFGKKQTIEVINNKTLILECDMQNKDVIISFILGFGSNVKVLEPAWLKEEIMNKLKTIGSLYE